MYSFVIIVCISICEEQRKKKNGIRVQTGREEEEEGRFVGLVVVAEKEGEVQAEGRKEERKKKHET